jgi:hypothetical protein
MNTTDFVTDLLEGVAGLIPVQGNLSPMVEVTRFEKIGGSYELLHLVNGSGHFGVSFFAPATMTNIEVAIPSPQQPKTLMSLVWGRSYDYTWQDGHLIVRIPRLELFDAIKIE